MSRLQLPHKVVAGHRYVHAEAFALLPTDALATLVAAEALARVARGEQYNVARFENSSNRITLLHYPSFFKDAFPALLR
jgi:hypothetical protein